MEKKTANNLENNKEQGIVEQYKVFIGKEVTKEGEEFMKKIRLKALENSNEYQTKKAELEALKVSILTPIVNRAWAKKLANLFYKRWRLQEDALLSLIIDTDGNIIKKDKKTLKCKKCSISSVSEAASFMAYLRESLITERRAIKDLSREIYLQVKGGLVWLDIESVVAKVSQEREIPQEKIIEAYNFWKAKEDNEAKE